MNRLRVGLWGARHDNTGLGIQTKEFYDHIEPDKTLVVDISALNASRGKISKLYPERYPKNAEIISGFPGQHEVDRFLRDLDIVFMIESPYTYQIIDEAKRRGIKTVLQYNYEFLDYFERPEWPMPDCLASPTVWNIDIVKQRFGIRSKVVHLPVPVNRQRLPFKPRTKAKTFLHIAGHKTLDNRNGTDVVLEAIDLVKSKDVEFRIYTQHSINAPANISVRVETKEVENYWELYGNEEILLLPRKYGGLSLQMQESLSVGMVPVMTNVLPQNTFLDEEGLILCSGLKKLYTRMNLNSYQVNPKVLADKIDQLVESPKLVARLSHHSNKLATAISWEKLKPVYFELFEELVNAGNS